MYGCQWRAVVPVCGELYVLCIYEARAKGGEAHLFPVPIMDMCHIVTLSHPHKLRRQQRPSGPERVITHLTLINSGLFVFHLCCAEHSRLC